MKHIFLITLVFTLLTSLLFGQQLVEGKNAEQLIPGASLIRYTAHGTSPDYIELYDGKKLTQESGLIWISNVLGLSESESFTLTRTENDKLGMTHYMYQHRYNTIPVMHSEYRLHMKDGFVQSFNGAFYSIESLNTTPAISTSEAIDFAKNNIGAEQYMNEQVFVTAAPELVIAPVNGDFKKGNFKLCWKTDIYASNPLSRNWVYVDAQTGEIIWKTERIHDTDVPGTAQTVFSGSRNIISDFNGSSHTLMESGRGSGIVTQNVNNTDDGSIVTDFEDVDNDWGIPTPPLDQYALDAHWGSEMTYDYYMNVHNRNSIDDQAFLLQSYVHFGTDYGNAFWDGNVMVYGDGDGIKFDEPLTEIMITGHEISHGLTQYTANLEYSYESGALNESFSDIFGITIENFATGNTGNTLWRLAEICTTSGTGIRVMNNPNEKNDPDTYLGDFWMLEDTTTIDYGGVHTNSGVQNFWYYLLCDGGTGTNDNGDAYDITAIGMEDAADIAFRNLTVYLGANSQYIDAAFYAIQSAKDLFGNCSPEMYTTKDAWSAVGVDPTFPIGVQASFNQTAVGFLISFHSTSTGATSYQWNFGDGNTSTLQNPTHGYVSAGTYTVTLIVNSGFCTDTTTAVINVSSGVGLEEISDASVSVTPNPFKESVSIQLQGGIGTQVKISAVNSIGQKVEDIFSGTIQTENSDFVWKAASGLAPGVYFIQIEQGSNRTTKRVVKY